PYRLTSVNDIIKRALIITNHDQFQHHVQNELCAQVVKSRTRDCNELQQFVQEACTQLKLQIIGLRLDVHEKSSIATNKYNVDLNFISTLFDIDKLKVIHDISQLKIKLNSPLEADQQTKTICHAVPISSKLQKLRRTDSDSSLLSSNLTSSTSSIDSDDLHNIDPKDPNVLYPPYYLPPPGFIPSTPNSTMSENDDDGTEALAAEPIGWVRLEPRPFLASVGSASVKF
ncbi:unnamed protein product, partial [Rotaria socialis]